jgi:hypothetical protein
MKPNIAIAEERFGVTRVLTQRSGCPRCSSSVAGASSRKPSEVTSESRPMGRNSWRLNTWYRDERMKAPATSPVM